MEKKLFSSSAFGSLTDAERRARLYHLEQELGAFIGQSTSSAQFFRRTKQSVEMLRSMGHDLWHMDSDGETFEVWAGDYIRPNMVGRLVITFTYPDRVSAEWADTL